MNRHVATTGTRCGHEPATTSASTASKVHTVLEQLATYQTSPANPQIHKQLAKMALQTGKDPETAESRVAGLYTEERAAFHIAQYEHLHQTALLNNNQQYFL